MNTSLKEFEDYSTSELKTRLALSNLFWAWPLQTFDEWESIHHRLWNFTISSEFAYIAWLIILQVVYDKDEIVSKDVWVYKSC